MGNLSVDIHYQVKLTKTTIIKAIGPLPEPHILTLSNLDLLSGRFPITYFYFYQKPLASNQVPIVDSLKFSLSKTLNLFYPFSGRIVENPKTHEPEIACDNTGALLVEALASISLQELNFYDLDDFLQGKLVSINDRFPLQVQVTNFTCGGVSIAFTFDHALGDASAFGKFLITWSEIATKKIVSCVPDHSRSLRARNPPSYDSWVDQAFVSCTMEDIKNMPTIRVLLKRLYHIDVSNINRIHTLACISGHKPTKIESFSAYVWKIMARSVSKAHTHCKMGWLVDGRTRISKEKKSMSNYIGNVLSLAFGEASIAQLNNQTLSDIAEIVHDSLIKVTNRDHFLGLIDWIECHRPGLVLSKLVLGLAGPALVISSGRRFPVSELDFGFGGPVLGTTCSTIERVGVGYMNQRPSARGDGSWIVSAILWPELVAELESDPHHVFEPMTSNHLQLI